MKYLAIAFLVICISCSSEEPNTGTLESADTEIEEAIKPSTQDIYEARLEEINDFYDNKMPNKWKNYSQTACGDYCQKWTLKTEFLDDTISLNQNGFLYQVELHLQGENDSIFREKTIYYSGRNWMVKNEEKPKKRLDFESVEILMDYSSNSKTYSIRTINTFKPLLKYSFWDKLEQTDKVDNSITSSNTFKISEVEAKTILQTWGINF